MADKRKLMLSGVVVSALALAACSGSPSGPAEPGEADADIDPRSFTVTTLYSPEHWQDRPVYDFADAVSAATDGNLSFEIFSGAALAGPAEVSAALRDGVADLGVQVFVYNAAEFPVDTWAGRLAHIQDQRPVVGYLQSAAATLEWSLTHPEVLAEFEENGLHALAGRFMITPDYGLLCREDYFSAPGHDLSGLRVRSGGSPWNEELGVLGMTPVSVPGPEVYESFQRGVFDCQFQGLPDLVANGTMEIGRYVLEGPFSGAATYGFNASADTWDSLTPAQQDAITSHLHQYMADVISGGIAETYTFYSFAEEQGIEVFSMDDAPRKALQDHQAEVVDGLLDTAPAGITDPQALIDSYIELHEKWLRIVEDLGYAEQDTWSEWASARTDGQVDLTPWADAVYEQIFSKRLNGS